MDIGETDKEKPQKFFILHVPGGGLWGKFPLRVLSVIERICDLPTSKLVNMTSGSSTGAIGTTALNIPKSKNSGEPRYTANDILHLYDKIGPKIFPVRKMYYARQIIVDEIIRNVHKFFGAFFAWGFSSLDRGLNFTVNSAKKSFQTKFTPTHPFNPVELKPFRAFHAAVIAPLEKRIDKSINYLAKSSLYDIGVLDRILSLAFRYEDTHESVPLNDTLMTHHVSAMNLTQLRPALFFHYRDPETGESDFASHHLDTKDITLASCAAQSMFEPVRLPGGDVFIDIAHFDTSLTPVLSLERHIDKKVDIKLVTIGTGQAAVTDPESLSGMLFLRQMSSEYGAPLFRLPQKYVNDIASMILEHRFDKQDLVTIDLPVTLESLKTDYLDDPRAIRLAKYMGLNLQDLTAADLPSHNICDSRPENMQNMDAFGWLMTLKNLDTILPLCSELIQNAHALGNINEDEMKSRLRLVEHFTSAADADNVPEPGVSNDHDWNWLTFDEVRKRPLKDQFRYAWLRATGRAPEPLQHGNKGREPVLAPENRDDSLPPPPPYL